MFLRMFNSTKSVNRVSNIVDLNQVIRRLNEENVFSALALLINKETDIFNILCIRENTSSSRFCNESIANISNRKTVLLPTYPLSFPNT